MYVATRQQKVKKTMKTNPRIYVGTYAAYNSGSTRGEWLVLKDYATFDDLLAKCRKVHAAEPDPEFMVQDEDGMPDGLTFRESLSRQDFDDVKAAMSEAEAPEQAAAPALNVRIGDAYYPALNVLIVDYSDKAIVVIGDTKPVKDDLKRLGGRFNFRLTCGAGWVFSKAKRADLDAFLTSGVVTAAEGGTAARQPEDEDAAQYRAWLDEAIAATPERWRDYRKEHNIGALKLGDAYYLIRKPDIECRFCFADEGPSMDRYRELKADETKMRQYFLDKNLAGYEETFKALATGEIDGYTRRPYVKIYEDDGVKLAALGYNREGESGWTAATDEQKAAILKAEKWGMSQFERRLQAYLKRYGVTKLHTWTYWADA